MKSINTHIEVRGKKAMVLMTILCIVAALFFYFIATVLEMPFFFVIALILILIVYIKNMISAYKDIKKQRANHQRLI